MIVNARTMRGAIARIAGAGLPRDMKVTSVAGTADVRIHVDLGFGGRLTMDQVDSARIVNGTDDARSTILRLYALAGRLAATRDALRTAGILTEGQKPDDIAMPAWAVHTHPVLLQASIRRKGDRTMPTVNPDGDTAIFAMLDAGILHVNQIALRLGANGVADVRFNQTINTGDILGPSIDCSVTAMDPIPQTVVVAIMEGRQRSLGEIIELPRCGIAEVDDAADAVPVSGISSPSGVATHIRLAPARYIRHDALPQKIADWMDGSDPIIL